MEKSEQISLIQKAAKGDSAAFSVLYQEYNDEIDHFCFNLLRDRGEADNIVQDAFSIAFQNLNTLNNALNFESWLKQIAADKCKDYLKKAKPDLFLNHDSESRNIYSRDTNKIINEIINRLPDEQRITIVLYYYEKKTIKEIAAFMESNENAIHIRLNQACKTIHEEIEAIEKRDHIKLHSAEISMFDALLMSETAYNRKSQVFEDAANRISKSENVSLDKALPSAKKSVFKRIFKTTASKIIAVILSIAVLVTGIGLIISNTIDAANTPFTIKNVELKDLYIPYDTFKSNDFFELYLKPVFVEAGFKEEDAYFSGTDFESEGAEYYGGKFTGNKYYSSGKFDIPNSRYALGFSYKLTLFSNVNYAAVYSADSYYSLYIKLNEKTSEYNGAGASSSSGGFEIFSGSIGIEPGTVELYEKLKEYFDQPDIKEKLLIEKQANKQ